MARWLINKSKEHTILPFLRKYNPSNTFLFFPQPDSLRWNLAWTLAFMLVWFINVSNWTGMRYTLLLFLFCGTFSICAQETILASNEILPQKTIVESKEELPTSMTWPFQLHGGLIMVEACIDDHRQQFLLDSGAPNLFINGKVKSLIYFYMTISNSHTSNIIFF